MPIPLTPEQQVAIAFLLSQDMRKGIKRLAKILTNVNAATVSVSARDLEAALMPATVNQSAQGRFANVRKRTESLTCAIIAISTIPLLAGCIVADMLNNAALRREMHIMLGEGHGWVTEDYSAPWRQQVGLPDGLRPHGLRKTTGKRLAETGYTAHQIAAITGHATLAEVQQYTRSVDQERLVREAMRKIATAKSDK